jgi:hypothetical protein
MNVLALWLSIVSGLGYENNTTAGLTFGREIGSAYLELQVGAGSKIDGGSTTVATALIAYRHRLFLFGADYSSQLTSKYGSVGSLSGRLGYSWKDGVLWLRLPDTSEHKAWGVKVDQKIKRHLWVSAELTRFDNSRNGTSVKVGYRW